MIRMTIILISLLCSTPRLGADVYVITNSANQLQSISKTEIKKIFLGERIHWADGTKIKIADNLGKEISKEFYKTYIGKDSQRIKNIWIKKMLRGSMSPPEAFKNSDELLTFVSEKKSCIGFVANKKLPKGVKVLKVTD